MKNNDFGTVDEYLALFPKEVQERMKQIRQIVREEAPVAVEGISYKMPGYKLNGKPLVYFGGWEKHIGFYPTPSGTEAFAKDLAEYKHAKGSAQFPHNKPLPVELIRQIVKFRVKECQKV